MKKLVKKECNLEREYYLDFLRIISCLAVILIHVSVQNWYCVDLNTFEWNTMTVYRSVAGFGNPIFIMISGALFLSRENSLKKLWFKNIKRIAIAFLVWSFIYAVYNFLLFEKGIDIFINSFLSGYGHMWFLFMIIGLYMIVPLVKPIAESEIKLKYFLILFFVIAIVIPQLIKYISFKFAGIAEILNKDLLNLNLSFIGGFTGYFLLGYFLNKCEFTRKQRNVAVIIGSLCLVLTPLIVHFFSNYYGKANVEGFDVFSINIFFYVIGMFVLGKTLFKQRKLNSFLKNALYILSKCSFGAYLIHMLILNILSNTFSINSLSLSPIIMIPILTIIVAVVSFLASFFISKIPYLGQYIV